MGGLAMSGADPMYGLGYGREVGVAQLQCIHTELL